MPRTKTPTAVKVRSGNPGKRKINKAEPQPKGRPTKPTIMTPMAKKVWDKLVAAMPEEVYTNADSALLAAYCEAVANHMHATSVIAEGAPLMVPGSTGQEVLNPIYKHQEAQARLIVSIGQRLGLDPIARQSINAGESQEADPFAGLLN